MQSLTILVFNQKDIIILLKFKYFNFRLYLNKYNKNSAVLLVAKFILTNYLTLKRVSLIPKLILQT